MLDQANYKPASGAKKRATATLALAMVLASLGTSIANIALPILAGAFDASFSQVQAVVIAYLAGLTICVVVAGHLGDRFGLKRMLLGGTLVFLVATLLCSVAPNLWLLIVARTMQGAGAAFMTTLSMALMRDTAGDQHVGRAMGLLGTVSAFGTALGPALGGVLLAAAGWRSLFWLQIPLAALTLLLAYLTLPADMQRLPRERARLFSGLDAALARNLLVNVLVAALMMTTLIVGPFYLGLGLGLQQGLMGLVMAIGPVLSILSGIPSGRLVDTKGSQRVLVMGLTMLALGAFMLAMLPEGMGLTGYVLSMLVLTPGYQLFQAANNTHILAGVAKDMRGTVSGLLSLSRNLGLIAGASVMGAVFAYGTGTLDLAQANPAEIAAGMRLAFLCAGGAMVAALAISAR